MGRGDARHSPGRPGGAVDAYALGLRMLAARELSVGRLSERLGRRGFSAPEIQAAVDRLSREGAVDDGRAALAVARAQVRRGYGRGRIMRALDAHGFDPSVARAAADQALGETDEAALLERAIDRRLRRPIRDWVHLQRLQRALVGHGFGRGEVLRALRRRASALTNDPDDE